MMRAEARPRGPDARAAALLADPIVDRDMGPGDRLIEAGAERAGQVLDAWARSGRADALRRSGRDPERLARRVVATRALYGIAPERADVTEARRRLVAWAADPDRPPVCVDHAIRRGHHALGFAPAQLAAFHSAPETLPRGASPGFDRWLAPLHAEHVARRRAVRRLAEIDGARARRALVHADAITDTVRIVGDVLAGCAPGDDADRAARQALAERWLHRRPGAEAAEAALRRLQAEVRRTRATFHWTSEFSELDPRAWQLADPTRGPR